MADNPTQNGDQSRNLVGDGEGDDRDEGDSDQDEGDYDDERGDEEEDFNEDEEEEDEDEEQEINGLDTQLYEALSDLPYPFAEDKESKAISKVVRLLESKADPNATVDGEPVLHKAVDSLNTAAVQMLLEKRADPNLTDAREKTALHRLAEASVKILHMPASANRVKHIVPILLKAGADVLARDNKDSRPSYYLNSVLSMAKKTQDKEWRTNLRTSLSPILTTLIEMEAEAIRNKEAKFSGPDASDEDGAMLGRDVPTFEEFAEMTRVPSETCEVKGPSGALPLGGQCLAEYKENSGKWQRATYKSLRDEQGQLYRIIFEEYPNERYIRYDEGMASRLLTLSGEILRLHKNRPFLRSKPYQPQLPYSFSMKCRGKERPIDLRDFSFAHSHIACEALFTDTKWYDACIEINGGSFYLPSFKPVNNYVTVVYACEPDKKYSLSRDYVRNIQPTVEQELRLWLIKYAQDMEFASMNGDILTVKQISIAMEQLLTKAQETVDVNADFNVNNPHDVNADFNVNNPHGDWQSLDWQSFLTNPRELVQRAKVTWFPPRPIDAFFEEKGCLNIQYTRRRRKAVSTALQPILKDANLEDIIWRYACDADRAAISQFLWWAHRGNRNGYDVVRISPTDVNPMFALDSIGFRRSSRLYGWSPGLPDVKIPACIGMLSQLRKVAFIGANLFDRDIPISLGFLGGLRELDLSNNQLTTLPHEFSDLKSLETLSLAHNKFSQVPAAVSEMHSLHTLNLCGNRITILCRNFSGLINLKKIDLRENFSIPGIQRFLETRMPGLKALF